MAANRLAVTVTVNNTTKNYSFTGGGAIAGTAL